MMSPLDEVIKTSVLLVVALIQRNMLRCLVIIGGISCTWSHMAKSMTKVKRKRYDWIDVQLILDLWLEVINEVRVCSKQA